MKHTDFQFGLRIAGGDVATVVHTLRADLEALEGIDSAETSISGVLVDLVLKVSFESANDAKKLHRRVMNKLISNKDLEISQVSTMLTDIF